MNAITQAGAMLGTPAFMAPEQARGQSKEVDGQTDLWAVGATLFSLISGRLVYEAESATMLLVKVGTTPPRSLASVAEDVPAAVVALVDRALAFEKSARWESATVMREALERAHAAAFHEPVTRDVLAAYVAGADGAVAPSASRPHATDDSPTPPPSQMATKVEGKGAAPRTEDAPATEEPATSKPSLPPAAVPSPALRTLSSHPPRRGSLLPLLIGAVILLGLVLGLAVLLSGHTVSP
jgi:serine/threonine-protein kinase